ncbi:hypothetical protein FDUTEX481_03505 [Tolypothrix sp. PCC 7601]|nr:hypothetical protein FDUTEX481_03505 [Tolypothrix sp. PCC 7601]
MILSAIALFVGTLLKGMRSLQGAIVYSQGCDRSWMKYKVQTN